MAYVFHLLSVSRYISGDCTGDFIKINPDEEDIKTNPDDEDIKTNLDKTQFNNLNSDSMFDTVIQRL